MTVIKTGMNEKLWLEKACCKLVPDLPLWIIEHAWNKRMMEVLQVLGPPLWLDGDWGLLTLEDPCRLRVVAAETWKIVQTRDIKNFERVTKFLDVTYLLVPRLVTPIKHMKIMFGLQTLVVMWMLWKDQSSANIREKIESLFSSNLPQYYKCGHRHMELMQKNREDFRSFAHVLSRDRSMREAYMRDVMEEQYGERYAQKLEERLSQYLEELEKVLTQPTCIEQVLKQSPPQGMGEKILKKLLPTDDVSLAGVLKRLLNCAVTVSLSYDDSVSLASNTREDQTEADVVKPSHRNLHVVSRPSQEDRLSQTSSKQLWISQGLFQNNSVEMCGDGLMCTSTHEPEVHQTGCSPSLLEDEKTAERRWHQKQAGTESEQQAEPEQMCSRHGKKMRSILQECSEELEGGAVQVECSPVSPQSTPSLPSQTHTSQTSASSHQNSGSGSSHQGSSSTNISTSYIQEMFLLTSASSKKPVTPSDLQITSSSPPSLLHSSSKQHHILRVDAEEMRDTSANVLTEPNRADGRNVKLSLESQSFLMQSRWLQPQVWLYRLSTAECTRVTESHSGVSEEEEESDAEGYTFFDVNALYSDAESDSSDTDDPDYNPNAE